MKIEGKSSHTVTVPNRTNEESIYEIKTWHVIGRMLVSEEKKNDSSASHS